MQQFQDDIMRVRQLTLEVSEKFGNTITELEERVKKLEDRIDKLERSI